MFVISVKGGRVVSAIVSRDLSPVDGWTLDLFDGRVADDFRPRPLPVVLPVGGWAVAGEGGVVCVMRLVVLGTCRVKDLRSCII